uniref:Uncharacterized protein n=1 Tax=Glossina brevipalpis TaxID=37001 RepID=A0A1A9WG20_9MUSC
MTEILIRKNFFQSHLTEHFSIQSVKPVKVTTLIESTKLPTSQMELHDDLSIKKVKDTSPFAEMTESSQIKTNLIQTIKGSPIENDLISSSQEQSAQIDLAADNNVIVTMSDPQYLDEIMYSGGVRRKILELEELQNINKINEEIISSSTSPQKHANVKHFVHAFEEKMSTNLEALPFTVRSRETKKHDVDLPVLEDQIFDAIDVELIRLTPSEPPTEVIKLSSIEALETDAENIQNIEEVVCEKICRRKKSFVVATEDTLLKLERKEFEKARSTYDDETESLPKVKDVVQSFERRHPLSSSEVPSLDAINLETKTKETPVTQVSLGSRIATSININAGSPASNATAVEKDRETVYIESKISKIAKMFETDLDRNKTQEFTRDNIYEIELKDTTGTHKTDDVVELCQLATISSRKQVCDTQEQYFTDSATKMTYSDNIQHSIDKQVWDSSTVRGKIMQYKEKWEFPEYLESATDTRKTMNITMVKERPTDQSLIKLESMPASSGTDPFEGQQEIEDGSSSSSQFHTPSEITPPDIRMEQFDKKISHEMSITETSDLDHSPDYVIDDNSVESRKRNILTTESKQIIQLSNLVLMKATDTLPAEDKEDFEFKQTKFTDRLDSKLIAPEKLESLSKKKSIDRLQFSQSAESVESFGHELVSESKPQRLTDQSEKAHTYELTHMQKTIAFLPNEQTNALQVKQTESTDKLISTEELKKSVEEKHRDELTIMTQKESLPIESTNLLQKPTSATTSTPDLKMKLLNENQDIKSNDKIDFKFTPLIETYDSLEEEPKEVITKPTNISHEQITKHITQIKSTAKLDSKLTTTVKPKNIEEKKYLFSVIDMKQTDALPPYKVDVPKTKQIKPLDKFDSEASSTIELTKALPKTHSGKLLDVKQRETISLDHADILQPKPIKPLGKLDSKMPYPVELKKIPEKTPSEKLFDAKLRKAFLPDNAVIVETKSIRRLEKHDSKMSSSVELKKTPKKEHLDKLLHMTLSEDLPSDHTDILKPKPTKPHDKLDFKVSSPVELRENIEKEHLDKLLDMALAPTLAPYHADSVEPKPIKPFAKLDSKVSLPVELEKTPEKEHLDKLIDLKPTDALLPDHADVLESKPTEPSDKLDSKVSSPVELKKSPEKEPLDKLIDLKPTDALPPDHPDILEPKPSTPRDKLDSKVSSPVELKKTPEKEHLDKLEDMELVATLPPDHEGILESKPSKPLGELDFKMSSPVKLKQTPEKEPPEKLLDMKPTSILPPDYADILESKPTEPRDKLDSKVSSPVELKKTPEKEHLDKLEDMELIATLPPDYANILERKPAKPLEKLDSKVSSPVELKKTPEKEHLDKLEDMELVATLPPDYANILERKPAKPLEKLDSKVSSPVELKKTPEKKHLDKLEDMERAATLPPDHADILEPKPTKPLEKLDSKVSLPVELEKTPEKEHLDKLRDLKPTDALPPDHADILESKPTEPRDKLDSKVSLPVKLEKTPEKEHLDKLIDLKPTDALPPDHADILESNPTEPRDKLDSKVSSPVELKKTPEKEPLDKLIDLKPTDALPPDHTDILESKTT